MRWLAPALAALVGCTSAVEQCGACPGSYLDPNGLIRPGEAIASVRVCIDGKCTTQTAPASDRTDGSYAAVTGLDLPDPRHVAEKLVQLFRPGLHL